MKEIKIPREAGIDEGGRLGGCIFEDIQSICVTHRRRASTLLYTGSIHASSFSSCLFYIIAGCTVVNSVPPSFPSYYYVLNLFLSVITIDQVYIIIINTNRYIFIREKINLYFRHQYYFVFIAFYNILVIQTYIFRL